MTAESDCAQLHGLRELHLSLFAATAGFLGRLTGNTMRCELDLSGFGGVSCPLGVHDISPLAKKLRWKPTSTYQQSAACGAISWTQRFIRNIVKAIILNLMISFIVFFDNYIFTSAFLSAVGSVYQRLKYHFLFSPHTALLQLKMHNLLWSRGGCGLAGRNWCYTV